MSKGEKNIMKKCIKRILSFVMAITMMFSVSNPIMAKESNTQDKNGNSVADMQLTGGLSYCFGPGCSIKIGNEIYFTINLSPREGIYKINKNATKATAIIKKHGSFTNLSRYGKWIYFIWDKDGGANGCSITSDSWLYKAKLNGTDLTKICRATSCMIRNNTLYYQKSKHGLDKSEGYATDLGTGKIGKINLKTGEQSTLPGSNMYLAAVEKNRIYYYSNNGSKNTLYAITGNGKNKEKLITEKDVWGVIKIIYNNTLYWTNNNALYKQSLGTKKTKKLCSIDGEITDIKDGRVYVTTNSQNAKLYSVSIKNGKKKYIATPRKRAAKVYGNYVLYSKTIDLPDHSYRGRLYSYNLKTKKSVRLLQWYEQ